ncbi:MAG: hypothetical protein WC522_01375 [Candidatus Omnitrophota bacterium]
MIILKTVKYIFAICLCIVVFTGDCRAGGAKLHRFDDLKFSMECPADHELQKSENTVSVVLSRPGDKQYFRPNIMFSSTPNTNPPIDLNAFFNLVLQNFLKDANFSIALVERAKLGGKDSYKLLYTRKAALKDKHDKVISTKVLQVYIIEPSRIYVMNYSAAEGDFDGYLAAADEIFRTFKVLS